SCPENCFNNSFFNNLRKIFFIAQSMSTIILAIESSCDETSASIIKDGKILDNLIATQSIHESYGGVVPELASRAHQANIVPVVNQALANANITKSMLSAVAFT